MTLREQIIRYRARHNLSQEEFAERCKVSRQTLNSVENGLQEPTELTKMKIKIALEGEKPHDIV